MAKKAAKSDAGVLPTVDAGLGDVGAAAPAAPKAPKRTRTKAAELTAAQRLAMLNVSEADQLRILDTYGLLRQFNPSYSFAVFMGSIFDGKQLTLERAADTMAAAAAAHQLDDAAQILLYQTWIDLLPTAPNLSLKDCLTQVFNPAPAPESPPASPPASEPAPAEAAVPAVAEIQPYLIPFAVSLETVNQLQPHLSAQSLTLDGDYGVFELPIAANVVFCLAVTCTAKRTYVAAYVADTTAGSGPNAKVIKEHPPTTTICGDYTFQSELVFNNHPFTVRVAAG